MFFSNYYNLQSVHFELLQAVDSAFQVLHLSKHLFVWQRIYHNCCQWCKKMWCFLFDKDKAETKQTEETRETKMGTRHKKKVDTYSNNKTWNAKPTSLPDLAKSYGRRASPNEEITLGTEKRQNVGSQISSPKPAGGGWNHSETLNSPPLNSVELAKRRVKTEQF